MQSHCPFSEVVAHVEFENSRRPWPPVSASLMARPAPSHVMPAFLRLISRSHQHRHRTRAVQRFCKVIVIRQHFQLLHTHCCAEAAMLTANMCGSKRVQECHDTACGTIAQLGCLLHASGMFTHSQTCSLSLGCFVLYAALQCLKKRAVIPPLQGRYVVCYFNFVCGSHHCAQQAEGIQVKHASVP